MNDLNLPWTFHTVSKDRNGWIEDKEGKIRVDLVNAEDAEYIIKAVEFYSMHKVYPDGS